MARNPPRVGEEVDATAFDWDANIPPEPGRLGPSPWDARQELWLEGDDDGSLLVVSRLAEPASDWLPDSAKTPPGRHPGVALMQQMRPARQKAFRTELRRAGQALIPAEEAASLLEHARRQALHEYVGGTHLVIARRLPLEAHSVYEPWSREAIETRRVDPRTGQAAPPPHPDNPIHEGPGPPVWGDVRFGVSLAQWNALNRGTPRSATLQATPLPDATTATRIVGYVGSYRQFRLVLGRDSQGTYWLLLLPAGEFYDTLLPMEQSPGVSVAQAFIARLPAEILAAAYQGFEKGKAAALGASLVVSVIDALLLQVRTGTLVLSGDAIPLRASARPDAFQTDRLGEWRFDVIKGLAASAHAPDVPLYGALRFHTHAEWAVLVGPVARPKSPVANAVLTVPGPGNEQAHYAPPASPPEGATARLRFTVAEWCNAHVENRLQTHPLGKPPSQWSRTERQGWLRDLVNTLSDSWTKTGTAQQQRELSDALDRVISEIDR